MYLPFKILKKGPDGGFRWFESVKDLNSAVTRIKLLHLSHPGEYVVLDQRADKHHSSESIDIDFRGHARC